MVDEEESDQTCLLTETKTDLPSMRETPPLLPVKIGSSSYYSVPITPTKPCMYIFASFEDLTKRLYHTNLLQTIAESFVRAAACFSSSVCRFIN